MASLVGHHVFEDLLKSYISGLRIAILGHLLCKVWVTLDVATERDKFYALFFWGSVPAVKVAFVKDFNDFFEFVFFFFTSVDSSWVGVLGLDL